MPLTESQLHYTALCRGDMEPLAEFVTCRLEGVFTVLLRAPNECLVDMIFPAKFRKAADVLHDDRIRDADGGCCWVSFRTKREV